MDYIETAGELSLPELPRDVMIKAEALSRIHGAIRVGRETSGLHLYMASPECLMRDGAVELDKKHLALNIEKFLGTGSWRGVGQDGNRCAKCMKYGNNYSMAGLLAMPPLSQRGYPDTVAKVVVANLDRKLFPDGQGNMIPAPPGDCIPITRLPDDHPAVQYLRGRGYDLPTLWDQFRCSFCFREFTAFGVGYRRLPGGFKDTPQNRIIFFGDIAGVQQIWQARVLEMTGGGFKFYYHPYLSQWVACEQYDLELKKYTVLPHLRSEVDDKGNVLKWDISKYRTATSSERQSCLMGFDAAVAWNARLGARRKTAILVEGPLDAGRIGPPAMPMIGKTLGEGQARLLTSHFQRVIFVSDNDLAGIGSRKSVRRALGNLVDLVFLDVPADKKDLGALDNDTAAALVGPHLFVGLW